MHTRQCVKTVLRRIIIKANKAKKAVSKAMTEKTEKALTELLNCPSEVLRLVCGLNTDSKEAECGMCMRGSDGRLCFSEK